MSERARVVWSEGMFLRTQHFQQQDRWVEAYVQGAVADLIGDGWGFRRLELNTGLLACATCHRQELAFTDGLPRSEGVTGQLHPRGAMSLVNVGVRMGARFIPKESNFDAEGVMEQIRGGAVGKVVDMESNGEHVEVWVE